LVSYGSGVCDSSTNQCSYSTSSTVCQNGCLNGACKLPSAGANTKLASAFSDKEVFLIADSDWQSVLQLVPLTTWSENGQVVKYPTLIYHKEGEAFDADSIIYFMQQYNTKKVTIVGSTPLEFDNLLVASPAMGAGISRDNIKRISVSDFLSYWDKFDTVVYVQNDYELAMLASTYASLIDAPLVIQGGALDSTNVLNSRKVICVGNVGKAKCAESYTLEALQKKYVEKTGTDKIMLVNPNDLNLGVENKEKFTKSSGTVASIYGKTSLAAPLLAAAKQEVIAFTNSKEYQEADKDLKSTIASLAITPAYLTIMATPDTIQQAAKGLTFFKLGQVAAGFTEVDNHVYGALDSDYFQDISVGRIYGITLSDVSAYIARDTFYDNMPHSTDFAVLWAPNFVNEIAEGKTIDKVLSSTGLAAKSVYSQNNGGPAQFDSKNDFENKALLIYLDHGWYEGGGNGYTSTSLIENDVKLVSSIVISDACSTNSYDKTPLEIKPDFFGAQLIRRGALAHFGNVEDAGTGQDTGEVIAKNMAAGFSTGMSLRLTRNMVSTDLNNLYEPYLVLLGDPTLNLNLKSPQNEEIAVNIKPDDKVIQIIWPPIKSGITIDFPSNGLRLLGNLFENHFGINVHAEYYLRDFKVRKDGQDLPETNLQASTVLVASLNMPVSKVTSAEIKTVSKTQVLNCAPAPFANANERKTLCRLNNGEVENPYFVALPNVLIKATRDSKGNDWLWVSIALERAEVNNADTLEAREFILHYE